MAAKEKERIVFIDYIRVVACLMVMLVHASENFYGADSSGMAGNFSILANEQNRFWVAFWDGGVSRTAVPMFMIVSAFLLLPMPQHTSMKEFYQKRFMRILPPFACFMLLYTFLPLLWNGMTFEQSMKDLKMLLFNFPSMAGHLWFIYPLISLYLIIPVISPWIERASAKDERLFLIFFTLSTFTPWLHLYVSPELWGECFWNPYSALWYCSGYIGYLVLSHYIRVHIKWSQNKRLAIGSASFIVGAAFTAWSFWWQGVPGNLIDTPTLEWAWQFCTPNVLLATFGLFLLFTCIRQKKAPAFIHELARLSFGMYLMHMFFLAPIASWIIGENVAAPILPVWLAIPIIALLSFVCCVATTKLLSYLPASKYFIGA